MRGEIYYLIRRDGISEFTITKWDGGVTPLVEYRLKTNNNNRLECSCPSGRYRNYCHHTKMLKSWLRNGEPQEELRVGYE